MVKLGLIQCPARVKPGDGIVARYGGTILVVPDPLAGRRGVEVLLGVLREHSSPDDGRELVLEMAGVLVGTKTRDLPAFCALAHTDGGVAILIHGDLQATVARTGEAEHLSGRRAATWVDQLIEDPFVSITVGPTLGDESELEGLCDLETGVVRGSGVVVIGDARIELPKARKTSESNAPEPADVHHGEPGERPEVKVQAASRTRSAHPETASIWNQQSSENTPAARPDAEDIDVKPSVFKSFDLAPDPFADRRPPLPLANEVPRPDDDADSRVIVRGIKCANGHFNPPDVKFCAACGIAMVQLSHDLVDGPRVPLGLLILDDGSAFQLDDDYVVGREPERDHKVYEGHARPLKIVDADRSVSRVHAEVVLTGWDVQLIDRGSANGTSICTPGSRNWTSLQANMPTVIIPGTEVRVGRRTLVYDAHFRR